MPRHPGNRAGTLPVDRPTPALSKRMTSRPDAKWIGNRRVPIVERPHEVLQTQERTRCVAARSAGTHTSLPHAKRLRPHGDVAGSTSSRLPCHRENVSMIASAIASAYSSSAKWPPSK